MFGLLRFAKENLAMCRKLVLQILFISVVFVILMLLFKSNMYVNIAISAVYVFAVFFALYVYGRQKTKSIPGKRVLT